MLSNLLNKTLLPMWDMDLTNDWPGIFLCEGRFWQCMTNMAEN